MDVSQEQVAIILFRVRTDFEEGVADVFLVMQLRPEGRVEKKFAVRIPWPLKTVDDVTLEKARVAAEALAGPIIADEFMTFLLGLQEPFNHEPPPTAFLA